MGNTSDAGLLELMNAYAVFHQGHPGADVDAFCRHRLARNGSAPGVNVDGLPVEAQMGRMLGRLSRMAQLYAKKVLQPLNVANLEDFSYLATLRRMDKPRKGELIKSLFSETTSGTSVIKRLVDQGWVQELNDPEDGRSVRVRVTPKGQRVLEKCFPRMQQTSRMIFGLLSPDERSTLFALLKKLDGPHAKLLIERREDSFDELVEALYGKR